MKAIFDTSLIKLQNGQAKLPLEIRISRNDNCYEIMLLEQGKILNQVFISMNNWDYDSNEKECTLEIPLRLVR